MDSLHTDQPATEKCSPYAFPNPAAREIGRVDFGFVSNSDARALLWLVKLDSFSPLVSGTDGVILVTVYFEKPLLINFFGVD